MVVSPGGIAVVLSLTTSWVPGPGAAGRVLTAPAKLAPLCTYSVLVEAAPTEHRKPGSVNACRAFRYPSRDGEI